MLGSLRKRKRFLYSKTSVSAETETCLLSSEEKCRRERGRRLLLPLAFNSVLLFLESTQLLKSWLAVPRDAWFFQEEEPGARPSQSLTATRSRCCPVCPRPSVGLNPGETPFSFLAGPGFH